MDLLGMFKPQAEKYKDYNPPISVTEQPYAYVAGQNLPDRTLNYYRLAGTNSMMPTLQTDDIAVGHQVPYDDLKEGDIINYKPKWNGGKVTIHRLVQKDKGGWIASGDNNSRSEAWERVTPANYIDKVVMVVRKPEKKTKAFADPVTLLLVAAFAAGVVTGTWKPLSGLFGKKPPTAQLTELQAKLDAQQAQAVEAAKAAEAAKIAEREKLEAQVRLAQGDALGVEAALKKVKSPTPETKLASRMAQRVSLKLAGAIGRLPQEQQEAMLELIDQALSDKQGEVDAANEKLAALDAQFKATTKARDDLLAQIPVLQDEARKSAQKAQETQAAVTAKTNEVSAWANKTQAALAENGSLWSGIKKSVLLIGAVWAVLAIGIPALIKHMDSANPLKAVLRDTSGFCLNPLMHLDAKKKIQKQ